VRLRWRRYSGEMFRSFSLATLLALQTAACFACGFLAAVAGVISSSFLFWFTSVVGILFSFAIAVLRRTSADRQFYIAVVCSAGCVPVAGYLALLAYAIRWATGLLPVQEIDDGELAVVVCPLAAAPAGVLALLLLREASWTYWDHYDSQQR
jgi:hypothetical protein